MSSLKIVHRYGLHCSRITGFPKNKKRTWSFTQTMIYPSSVAIYTSLYLINLLCLDLSSRMGATKISEVFLDKFWIIFIESHKSQQIFARYVRWHYIFIADRFHSSVTLKINWDVWYHLNNSRALEFFQQLVRTAILSYSPHGRLPRFALNLMLYAVSSNLIAQKQTHKYDLQQSIWRHCRSVGAKWSPRMVERGAMIVEAGCTTNDCGALFHKRPWWSRRWFRTKPLVGVD